LDQDTSAIAAGLRALGAQSGMRIALFGAARYRFHLAGVRPVQSGACRDPDRSGMGKRNLVRCLEAARPEGFVAISLAHAVRVLLRHRFRQARLNVTVGRRWFWADRH